MDYALTRIYLDSVSTNKVIITSQFRIGSLLCEPMGKLKKSEAKLLPQTPEDIARRQSLFHKLEQHAEESTSSLMNRIFMR